MLSTVLAPWREWLLLCRSLCYQLGGVAPPGLNGQNTWRAREIRIHDKVWARPESAAPLTSSCGRRRGGCAVLDLLEVLHVFVVVSVVFRTILALLYTSLVRLRGTEQGVGGVEIALGV